MWNSRLNNPLLVDAEDDVELRVHAAEQQAESDFVERAMRILSPLLSETQMETITRLSNQDRSDRAILFGCECIVFVNG